MKDVLISLISDIQATGGLIAYSDGSYAPVADHTWTDLGETVIAAKRTLEAEGIEVELSIDNVEQDSSEAELYL